MYGRFGGLTARDMQDYTDTEKIEYKEKVKRIKEQLPKICRNCSFLRITSVEKQTVYCPYLINNECLIGTTRK